MIDKPNELSNINQTCLKRKIVFIIVNLVQRNSTKLDISILTANNTYCIVSFFLVHNFIDTSYCNITNYDTQLY